MTKYIFKKNTIKSTSFKNGYYDSTVKNMSSMNKPFWFDYGNCHIDYLKMERPQSFIISPTIIDLNVKSGVKGFPMTTIN